VRLAGTNARPWRWLLTPVLVGLSATFIFVTFTGTLETRPESLGAPLSVGAELFLNRSYGADAVIAADHYLDDGHPLLWGSSFAELGFSWIPRQLWPDKPRSFSQQLGGTVFAFRSDAGKSFVAPHLTGEWLLNFGMIGVGIGWLLFGGLAAYIDERVTMPVKALWLFVVAHVVEGPLVVQFWLALPFLLGGSWSLKGPVLGVRTSAHYTEPDQLQRIKGSRAL